jgi:hypothetical protein
MCGCATVYDVAYDYDRRIDFNSLKTYDWMPAPDAATTDELVLDRVKDATDYELEAKGLVKVNSTPDFHVVPHFSAQEKIEVDNWGYGYGPYDYYWGGYWGSGGVATYEYEEGSLILDFVDPKTKHLIWRGSAKADIDYVDTPEKSWELIKKTVNEIMKKFPPPVE